MLDIRIEIDFKVIYHCRIISRALQLFRYGHHDLFIKKGYDTYLYFIKDF